MPTGIRPPAAAPPYELINLVDFRGGLNLSEDQLNLAENEVDNIVNFDLDPMGGLTSRHGSLRASQNMIARTGANPVGRAIQHMGYYGDSQGGEKLLLTRSDSTTSAIWCPTTGTLRETTGTNAAGFYRLGGFTYLLAHPAAAHNATRIDDADIMAGTLTAVNVGYESSYESPSTSGHPPARMGCVQHFRAWIVDETQVNRVRFSHPGDARYWHPDDWVDVGPVSSDIVGLYPLGDVILCVKQDSLWFIQGDVLSAIRIQRVDDPVSANWNDVYGTRSSVMAYGRVWIWARNRGLVSVSPNMEVTPHAENLRTNGSVPDISQVSVAGGKVFCRVDGEDGTYVFDTRSGGWTYYDMAIGDATDVSLGTSGTDGTDEVVFLDESSDSGAADHHYVMTFDDTLATDSRGATPTVTPVRWSVRTPWLVSGAPTEKKKWGRPRVKLESKDGTTDLAFTIRLRKNFNPDSADAVDVAVTHDVSELGATGDFRGPSGGRAEAVQYSVFQPSADTTGRAVFLHVIAPRYRPMRIKR